jgi:hypothetical protein
VILAALTPYKTTAQTILITEPVEWRDGRPAILKPGQSLRVAGTVSHPSGVLKVLVNGQDAFLQPDANYPDLFRFEKILVATNTTRDVTIAIVPRTSQQYARTYGVNNEAALRSAESTGATAAPAANANGAQELHGNPWKPFKLRSIGYVAAAGGGAALAFITKTETKEVCGPSGGGIDCVNRTESKAAYRVPGLALAGAAMAGLVIDAVITSGKSKRSSTVPPSEDERSGFKLEALHLAPTASGTRIELFRINYFRP